MNLFRIIFLLFFFPLSNLFGENIPALIPVPIGDTCRYIDEEGKFRFRLYLKCAAFESEYTTVKKRDYSFVLIDSSGKEIRILSSLYQYEGVKGGLIRIEKNGYLGFMNLNGEVVVPPKYADLHFVSEDRIAYCHPYYNQSRDCGYLNTKGEKVIEETLTHVTDFKNGTAWVRDRNYKWVRIDTEGKELQTTVVLDDLCALNEGLTAVRVIQNQNRQIRYVSDSGKWKDPSLEFVGATSFSEGLAFFFRNNSVGVFDESFRILWEKPYTETNLIFRREETYQPPNTILQFIYCSSETYLFKSGFALIPDYEKKAGYSYVGHDGMVLGGKTFLKAENFQNGYASVEFKEEEKTYHGILNTKGKIIYRWQKQFGR